MAGPTARARKLLATHRPVLPSPADIADAQTPAGGWTAETLARWGVPWPPPDGWRDLLEQRWHDANPQLDFEGKYYGRHGPHHR